MTNYFALFFKQKGFTIKAVASLLGYSSSYLSKMINGDRRMPDDFIDRLCIVFPYMTAEEKFNMQIQVKKVQKLYDERNSKILAIKKAETMSYVTYFFKLLEADNQNKAEIKSVMGKIIENIKELKEKYGIEMSDNLFEHKMA